MENKKIKKQTESMDNEKDICKATGEKGCAGWEMPNGDCVCLDCGRIL